MNIVYLCSLLGLIWECYPTRSRRGEDWQAELAAFWRAVEADMQVTRLFTQPLDPAIPEGYTEFLGELGYAPDRACPRWWSKQA